MRKRLSRPVALFFALVLVLSLVPVNVLADEYLLEPEVVDYEYEVYEETENENDIGYHDGHDDNDNHDDNDDHDDNDYHDENEYYPIAAQGFEGVVPFSGNTLVSGPDRAANQWFFYAANPGVNAGVPGAAWCGTFHVIFDVTFHASPGGGGAPFMIALNNRFDDDPLAHPGRPHFNAGGLAHLTMNNEWRIRGANPPTANTWASPLPAIPGGSFVGRTFTFKYQFNSLNATGAGPWNFELEILNADGTISLPRQAYLTSQGGGLAITGMTFYSTNPGAYTISNFHVATGALPEHLPPDSVLSGPNPATNQLFFNTANSSVPPATAPTGVYHVIFDITFNQAPGGNGAPFMLALNSRFDDNPVDHPGRPHFNSGGLAHLIDNTQWRIRGGNHPYGTSGWITTAPPNGPGLPFPTVPSGLNGNTFTFRYQFAGGSSPWYFYLEILNEDGTVAKAMRQYRTAQGGGVAATGMVFYSTAPGAYTVSDFTFGMGPLPTAPSGTFESGPDRATNQWFFDLANPGTPAATAQLAPTGIYHVIFDVEFNQAPGLFMLALNSLFEDATSGRPHWNVGGLAHLISNDQWRIRGGNHPYGTSGWVTAASPNGPGLPFPTVPGGLNGNTFTFRYQFAGGVSPWYFYLEILNEDGTVAKAMRQYRTAQGGGVAATGMVFYSTAPGAYTISNFHVGTGPLPTEEPCDICGADCPPGNCVTQFRFYSSQLPASNRWYFDLANPSIPAATPGTPIAETFHVEFDVRFLMDPQTPGVGHLDWGLNHSVTTPRPNANAAGRSNTTVGNRWQIRDGAGWHANPPGGDRVVINGGISAFMTRNFTFRYEFKYDANNTNPWTFTLEIRDCTGVVQFPRTTLQTAASSGIGPVTGMIFYGFPDAYVITNFNVALGQLFVAANTAALQALVDSTAGFVQANYSVATWTTFAAARTNATNMITAVAANPDAYTQLDVNAVYDALVAAIAGLRALGGGPVRVGVHPGDANAGRGVRSHPGYTAFINAPFAMDGVIFGGLRDGRNPQNGNTLWFDITPTAANSTGHVGFAPRDRQMDHWGTNGNVAVRSSHSMVTLHDGYFWLRNGTAAEGIAGTGGVNPPGPGTFYVPATGLVRAIPFEAGVTYSFSFTYCMDSYEYLVVIENASGDELWRGELELNTVIENRAGGVGLFHYLNTPSQGVTNIGQMSLLSGPAGTGHFYVDNFSVPIRGITDNRNLPLPVGTDYTVNADGTRTWLVGPSHRNRSIQSILLRYGPGDTVVLEAGVTFAGPIMPLRGAFNLVGASAANPSIITVASSDQIVQLGFSANTGNPFVLENLILYGNMDDILEIVSCYHPDLVRGHFFEFGSRSFDRGHQPGNYGRFMGRQNRGALNNRGLSLGNHETYLINVELFGNATGIGGGTNHSVTVINSHIHNNAPDMMFHNFYPINHANPVAGATFRMENSTIANTRAAAGTGLKALFPRIELYGNHFYNNHQAFELTGRDPIVGRVDADIVNNIIRVPVWASHGVMLGSDGTGDSRGYFRLVNNSFILEGGGTTFLRTNRLIAAIELYNNVFYAPGFGIPGGGGGNVFLNSPGLTWYHGQQVRGYNNWIDDRITDAANAPFLIGGAYMVNTTRGTNAMLDANFIPQPGSPLTQNPGINVADAHHTWPLPVRGANTLPNPLLSLEMFGRGDSAAPTLGARSLPVTITSVTVTPATADVAPGATEGFAATVTGTNMPPQTVTWTVEGTTNPGTTVSAAGVLTVAANETAATLTVRATSVFNTAVSGTATVTIVVPQPTALPAPGPLTLANNVVSWPPVANAAGYRIYVNGVAIRDIDATSFNLAALNLAPGSHSIQVRAIAGPGYLNSGLSVSVTFVVPQPPTPQPPADTGTIVPPSQPRPPAAPTPRQTVPVNDDAVLVGVNVSRNIVTLQLPTSVVNEIIRQSDDVASFDLTSVEAAVGANLPRAAVRAFADADIAVELQLPGGTVTLDTDAAYSLGQQAHGTNVTITLEEVEPNTFEIAIQSGNREIAELDGYITISLPAEEAQYVWLVDETGKLTLIESEFDAETGLLTFVTNQLGTFVLGDFHTDEAPPEEVVLPTVPEDTPPPPTIIRFAIGVAAYTVGATTHAIDVVPFIDPAYNRTMLPLRAVADALGARVNWCDETRVVTIYHGDEILTLTIGVSLPDNMGVPVIVDDRAFVPARYVVEFLGAEVYWDEANRAVYITR